MFQELPPMLNSSPKMTLRELQEQSRWLLQHASNVTSERGEDGIIAKSLDLLPERNGWCIEFGAWDGRRASNTYNLITTQGYRGVLIESDADRFRDLQDTHDPQKNILINAAVGSDKHNSLDALLRGHPVPMDVDILSIDIDGNDYHVWAAISSFRPKLVVIEYNPTIANAVRFVQEKSPGIAQGASAAALVELAKSKGYELIAVTGWNLFFVDDRYYGLFGIPDNSLVVMRDSDEFVPQIFMGYDGRVFLSMKGERGVIAFPWHPSLILREGAVQALPKRLQKNHNNYTRTEKFLYRWWVRLRRRGFV
jgi:hypothetical protein